MDSYSPPQIDIRLPAESAEVFISNEEEVAYAVELASEAVCKA